MKKVFLVLCFLVLSTTTGQAACNDGTERSGFCVSNKTLNWWSAAAWCQANGKTLATMYDVCPNWDGNKGSAKCSVLGGSGAGWVSTANGFQYAFVVDLGSGSVSGEDKEYRHYGHYAICK